LGVFTSAVIDYSGSGVGRGVIGAVMTERISCGLKGQILGLVKAFWIFSTVKLLS
jgi:hypothetical protein